ncbi:hypothetical protein V498_01815 [Pseudogymnoascus sp. VKM F-4517 (FW-2822)]|nr:hypothetical protein V498_01815 [Pseudogymnoascus sp. VKM F-4517 (FW-2822)]
MSRGIMAKLVDKYLGGGTSPQPDIESGISHTGNAAHPPQLQAHAGYDGRHDYATDERLFLFRHLTGITTHPSMVGSRAAPNLGIYTRVVDNEAKAKKGHKYYSWLINGCLGVQVIVAAALTALGAAGANHTAITAFGAINTVIAGVLTFLKGSGLPNRLKYYHSEWKQIREFIEQRERDLSRPGCDLDVFGVIGMIEKMYEEVKTDLEASTPDRFAGFGTSKKQSESATKDSAFNLPRVETGGFSEKLKSVQSGFNGLVSTDGLKDKLAGHGSELGNNASEGTKGNFKEFEAGLAGRAKDMVMDRIRHKPEVVQVTARGLQTPTVTVNAQTGQTELPYHNIGDTLKDLVSDITHKAKLAHEVVRDLEAQRDSLTTATAKVAKDTATRTENAVNNRSGGVINISLDGNDVAKPTADTKP